MGKSSRQMCITNTSLPNLALEQRARTANEVNVRLTFRVTKGES
jgi:hypothetical protein